MADTIVPQHVGFIVDGNRRWAKERGKPTFLGHKTGFDKLKEIMDYTHERGVKYVTAFIFSTENWDRSKEEVKYLIDLYRDLFTKEVKRLHEKNVRVNILGHNDGLAPDIIKMTKEGEDLTKNNTKAVASFCFNYGGEWELAEACKQICKSGIDPDTLTPEVIKQHLYHPEVPKMDMLVRTSGEQRISGFMLYRAAYSELMFLKKYWPDMEKSDVDDIIAEYQRRNRRFGK
ncbi:polyprenyl diphosphate synthase [Candidatus Saccharibacteria bacterium]|nr:polyprenyl diphosphate synthase [Candidatus Saccharibacteria bacterium]